METNCILVEEHFGMTLATDRPRLTITLDDETSEWLDQLSEETGLSKSHLVLETLKMRKDSSAENRVIASLSLEKMKALRLRAEQNYRPIEDEVRYLIDKGIEQNQ